MRLCHNLVHCLRRHAGIFIARGKEDALVTKNMVPGESVYGEKRVSVEVLDCPGALAGDPMYTVDLVWT